MKTETLQLDRKKNKIQFKDRFNLVEIENFLEKNDYQRLKENFPSERYFSIPNEFAKSLNDEHDQFNSFINNSKIWKDFIGTINTKKFVDSIINFFNIKNIYFSKKSWKRFIPYYKEVKLSFCFNISKNGGYSLPHTDSSRKLASFVLFFVDETWNAKNGGYVNLYKPKNPLHENNWRNERIQKHYLEIIKTIIPSQNKVYGFKKTKNSYHSVEAVVEINSLYRKVLMFNLIYANSNDAPYENLSFTKRIIMNFLKIIK